MAGLLRGKEKHEVFVNSYHLCFLGDLNSHQNHCDQYKYYKQELISLINNTNFMLKFWQQMMTKVRKSSYYVWFLVSLINNTNLMIKYYQKWWWRCERAPTMSGSWEQRSRRVCGERSILPQSSGKQIFVFPLNKQNLKHILIQKKHKLYKTSRYLTGKEKEQAPIKVRFAVRISTKLSRSWSGQCSDDHNCNCLDFCGFDQNDLHHHFCHYQNITNITRL